jgi:PAS domain S-box-containing protein
MNRFESLFLALRDPLSIAGIDGRFQEVNPAFSTLVGYPEGALVGRSFLDFVHDEDRRAGLEHLERLADGTPSIAFENRWRCHDGSYRWLAWKAELDGSLVYAIAHDVTAQKHAEETAQHFAALVESSVDGIIGKDLTGKIRSWNRGAEKLFGYSHEETIGRDVRMLVPDEERQEKTRLLAHVRRGRYVSDRELTHLRKDGTEVLVALTLSPIHDAAGHLVGSSSIVRDVTERKRAEEATEEANRAKSDFLANVSHEMLTPISGIMGTSTMLCDLELSPRARELVKIIDAKSAGLRRVIDKVLDFSEVETGQLTLEAVDFRLREPLQKTIHLLSVEASEKGVELTLDVAAGVPEALHGDAPRLRQVLYDLVSNAIKFTPIGKVKLQVEPEPRLSDSDSDSEEIFLRFTVCDTGIGIGNETREQLFAPFTQADTSMSRRYGGTGLGLAISHQIVELMGGELEVESSTPGEGSVFTFTACFTPAVELSEERQRALEGPFDASSYHLLLAEDEPINQMIALCFVEKLHFQADAVANGLEVLETLEREPYDLILMDCQMPELDGYEATRRIRSRESDGHRIPIIAVTAHAMKGDREKCLAAGMDDYLAKPYEEEELAVLLKRWLVGVPPVHGDRASA